MSFEKFLDDDAESGDFGKARYIRNFKGRQNISKLRLDSDSGSEYLEVNGLYFGKYDELGNRYCACTNLVYDAMLVLFDQSSTRTLVYRFMEFSGEEEGAIAKHLKYFGEKSEARVIGLQNGQLFGVVEKVYSMIRERKIGIYEVDVFGNEQRHVAVDLKTGATFDILMENRLYKPGERVNRLTREQFERSVAAAKNANMGEAKNETKVVKNLR